MSSSILKSLAQFCDHLQVMLKLIFFYIFNGAEQPQNWFQCSSWIHSAERSGQRNPAFMAPLSRRSGVANLRTFSLCNLDVHKVGPSFYIGRNK